MLGWEAFPHPHTLCSCTPPNSMRGKNFKGKTKNTTTHNCVFDHRLLCTTEVLPSYTVTDICYRCVEFSDSRLRTSIVVLAKRHLLSSKILCGRMWSLKGSGEGFLTQVSQLFVHISTSPPPLPFFYIFSQSPHHLPSPLPACWPLCVPVCLSVLLIFLPIKSSPFYSYPSFYMSSDIVCFQTQSLKYSAAFFF